MKLFLTSIRPAFLFAAALLLTVPLPAPAQQPQKSAPVPEGVKAHRDLEYIPGGGQANSLDLFVPEAANEPLPLIVWVHGGGWHQGDKSQISAAWLASKGFVAASINYRLSGQAKFPAQLEDGKAAIRWLRANAKKYHIDPERVGATGGSAGGHLVALLGTTGDVKDLEGKGGSAGFSSRVQAVCAFCAATDLHRLKHPRARQCAMDLIGGPLADHRELYAKANPITHITENAPPFLLIHGDKDDLVPLEQSELLHDALKKAGVPTTLHVAKGLSHSVFRPHTFALMEEFFVKHLKPKASEK
jgi:acetyl esterase/lipase